MFVRGTRKNLVPCDRYTRLRDGTFVILSGPTDANGYFFATLSPSEVEDNWRLSECKAFLHSSPDASCAHPTDVNRGASGASLSSYSRRRGNGKTKLYAVGPFLYAPGPSGH